MISRLNVGSSDPPVFALIFSIRLLARLAYHDESAETRVVGQHGQFVAWNAPTFCKSLREFNLFVCEF
jgi:hypothetical protein